MKTRPENTKPYGALRITSSIAGGIICGFLMFFITGLSIMETVARRPLLLIPLMVLGSVIITGLFLLIFIKSPSNKSMFGRMSICIGILVLLLPLALFINLTIVGFGSVTGYFSDFLRPAILRNTIVSICFGTLCMFVGIGFIVQAYFLLRRNREKTVEAGKQESVT